MAILIKGLDMPKDGEWYNIVITSNGKGFVDVVSEDNALTKTESIQAVEIPTPHGRLIDGDELMELYADEDGIDLSIFDVRIAVVRQNIKDMETIIEAEE